MEKKLLPLTIIILLLISIANLRAQKSSYGIKGGATAYQLISEFGDFSSTSDPKIGFEAGIFGDFPINRILSIQPEAVFVQKGGEETSESLGNSSATLSYVDVPLLLKIKAPLDGSIKPYIFGGPYAGYLVDATSHSDDESQDLTEYLNEIHYGLKVGLGVHIGKIMIDARYDMGIANLYKEDINLGGADGEITLNTTGVVVSLGIMF